MGTAQSTPREGVARKTPPPFGPLPRHGGHRGRTRGLSGRDVGAGPVGDSGVPALRTRGVSGKAVGAGGLKQGGAGSPDAGFSPVLGGVASAPQNLAAQPRLDHACLH